MFEIPAMLISLTINPGSASGLASDNFPCSKVGLIEIDINVQTLQKEVVPISPSSPSIQTLRTLESAFQSSSRT